MHVVLALGAALAAGAVTGGREHSPPVRLSAGAGSVGSTLTVTPDGRRVVYSDRRVAGGPRGLFVVPIDGSAAPRRVTPIPVAGGHVVDFQLDPTGGYAVYRADQDVDGVFELYSVPLDGGGSSVKLNGALVAGGNVQPYSSLLPGYLVSSDGARVVYLADQDADEVVELYSVAIDGSVGPTKLNAPLPTGGDVLHQAIAPGDERVLYRADQDVDGVIELYGAPIEGGALPVRINTPLAVGRNVGPFQIAADGSRVVYTADPYILRVSELFSAAVDGTGVPIRLNYPLANGDRVTTFALGPDGRRVAFAELRGNRFWTGSAAVAGAGLGLLASRAIDETSGAEIGPDGERVVWDEGDSLGGSHGLRSGPCRKGNRTAEVVELVARLGYGYAFDFEITPDSRTVVYTADDYGCSDGRLMSVPIDGSRAAVEISASRSSCGFVSGFVVDSDSATVVYTAAHEDEYGTVDLYRTPVGGGRPPQRISGPIARYGTVPGFRLAADDRCVAFVADRQANGIRELYVTCVLEVRELAPSSGPFAGGTRVVLEGLGFTPGATVAFDGRPATSIVRLDGSTLVATTPPLPVPPRSGRRALVRRTVDVVVTDGTASVRLAGAFTYTYR